MKAGQELKSDLGLELKYQAHCNRTMSIFKHTFQQCMSVNIVSISQNHSCLNFLGNVSLLFDQFLFDQLCLQVRTYCTCLNYPCHGKIQINHPLFIFHFLPILLVPSYYSQNGVYPTVFRTATKDLQGLGVVCLHSLA